MREMVLRKSKTGVPILSRKEIDELGESIVYEFCPEALVKQQSIDVDLLAEEFLGVTLDFQYLSNCGLYLMCTA